MGLPNSIPEMVIVSPIENLFFEISAAMVLEILKIPTVKEIIKKKQIFWKIFFIDNKKKINAGAKFLEESYKINQKSRSILIKYDYFILPSNPSHPQLLDHSFWEGRAFLC